MLNSFDNYIFDLDGTLINSSEEVLLCFKKAFLNAGYPVDESRFTSDVIGPPLRQIIAIIAPDLTDEEIVSSVIKNFRTITWYRCLVGECRRINKKWNCNNARRYRMS